MRPNRVILGIAALLSGCAPALQQQPLHPARSFQQVFAEARAYCLAQPDLHTHEEKTRCIMNDVRPLILPHTPYPDLYELFFAYAVALAKGGMKAF